VNVSLCWNAAITCWTKRGNLKNYLTIFAQVGDAKLAEEGLMGGAPYRNRTPSYQIKILTPLLDEVCDTDTNATHRACASLRATGDWPETGQSRIPLAAPNSNNMGFFGWPCKAHQPIDGAAYV
jgi:hypothetical protein